MRIISTNLLLAPLLLLLTAACTDHHPVAPAQETSFHHRPGHGAGGGGEVGKDGHEIVNLGTLGGSTGSAWAGNLAGLVVGGSSTADGESRPFVWTEAGGMGTRDHLKAAGDINEKNKVVGRQFVYDLDTDIVLSLPGVPEHTSHRGLALNDDGWVAGTSWRNLESGGSIWRTLVWIPQGDGSYGEPMELDCPEAQYWMDINRRGDVIANDCRGQGSPPQLWIRTGDGYDPPVVLGTLGGLTKAMAIDDRGRVAGWADGSQARKRMAVLWHPNDYSAPIELGEVSIVVDMSNENQVVGYRNSGDGGATGVVWTVDESGHAAALQQLPGLSGYPRSIPRGMTDDGWVVGQVFDDHSQSTAVIWRPLAGGNDGDGDDDCNPHPRTGVCRN